MVDRGQFVEPVPVLLVTGFLGTGKTTLINALLQGDHDLVLAAVVNDFGAISIDEAILSATGQPVYGLANGCICCTLQGDLLRTLRTILSAEAQPDMIIIEASGVSDPSGIIQALFDPVLKEAVALDAVVTVVDAENCDAEDDLWQAQLRASDFVALSKTEHAGPGRLEALHGLFETMHKSLVFVSDEKSGVPLDIILGGDLRRHENRFVSDCPPIADDRFVRAEWSTPGAISLTGFQAAMQAMAPQILRAKGFLSVRSSPETYLFQLAGRCARLSVAQRRMEGTHLVLIGRSGSFDAQAVRVALDALVLP